MSMRMFQNPIEACKEIERDLWELGTTVKGEKVQSKEVGKEGWTKELMGYTYSLPLANPIPRMQPVFEWLKLPIGQWGLMTSYILINVEERMSGKPLNPGYGWKMWPEYWTKYLKADGTFDYTYAERMCYSLPEVEKHLQREPFSRQGIVAIWHGTDLDCIGKERVPCSMYYHFMIREEGHGKKLHLIYNMRSCDLYTHFIYDQAMALLLGERMALKLDVGPGRFIHQMGSLHAYYTDLERREVF